MQFVNETQVLTRTWVPCKLSKEITDGGTVIWAGVVGQDGKEEWFDVTYKVSRLPDNFDIMSVKYAVFSQTGRLLDLSTARKVLFGKNLYSRLSTVTVRHLEMCGVRRESAIQKKVSSANANKAEFVITLPDGSELPDVIIVNGTRYLRSE